MPISASLRQGSHIKVAAVASRWQRVGDLIGSGYELHTSRTRNKRLTTCVIWPVTRLIKNVFTLTPALTLTLTLTANSNPNPKAQLCFRTDEMTSFFEQEYRYRLKRFQFLDKSCTHFWPLLSFRYQHRLQ